MNNIAKIINLQNKIACITLDFEKDYGYRTGQFNIFKSNKKELLGLADLFSSLKIPVSSFITTGLLTEFPDSLEMIKKLSQDYHCHSHTHRVNTGRREEIIQSAAAFKECFGYEPLGYRAPLGILHKGDIETMKESGFKFSSSVFPSIQPGKFCNFAKPTQPFYYDNGLLELPFAVVPFVRQVVSLSYLKISGIKVNKLLISMFGLPNLVVFSTHLHDFIVNQESFNKLPVQLKIAWGINKNSGIKYFTEFIELLKKREYQFITLTDLYNHLEEEDL